MGKKIIAVIAAIICFGSAAILMTSCGKSEDATDAAIVTDAATPSDAAIAA